MAAGMDEANRKLKVEVQREMVDHLVKTGGNVATPADPVAKVRRSVLRGLRD